jgi:hypothetical protein
MIHLKASELSAAVPIPARDALPRERGCCNEDFISEAGLQGMRKGLKKTLPRRCCYQKDFHRFDGEDHSSGILGCFDNAADAERTSGQFWIACVPANQYSFTRLFSAMYIQAIQTPPNGARRKNVHTYAPPKKHHRHESQNRKFCVNPEWWVVLN